MDENAKTAPVPAGRWLALIVAAVILAEGIWAMLVSITRSLLLPLVARVTGGDSQSVLYLGKGDINVPDLFGSVLQLCLAGIAFLIIKSWPAKATGVKIPKVRASKVISPLPVAPQRVTPTAQTAVASAVPAARPQPPAPAPPAAQPSAPPQLPPKPAKPEKPKEVYYNIVGEPITPDEDE